MRKKLLSLALALVMCLGLTVPAMAKLPENWDEWKTYLPGCVSIKRQGTQGQYDESVWRASDTIKASHETFPGSPQQCAYDVVSLDTSWTVTNNSPDGCKLDIIITKWEDDSSYYGYGECLWAYWRDGKLQENSFGEAEIPAGQSVSFSIADIVAAMDHRYHEFGGDPNRSSLAEGDVFDIHFGLWTEDFDGYRENPGTRFYKIDSAAVAAIMAQAPASGTPSTPSAPSTGFTDVAASAYYAAPVTWAVEKGITNGTDNAAKKFSPGQNCTNAQILTFLWRAYGEPEPTIASPFTNPIPDAYTKAAIWAYEKGMVSGAVFDADTPCTRAMAVTYMWQASGSPAPSFITSFTDVPDDAFYAMAVAWALEEGITKGTDPEGTLFSPTDICSRGQIVTFLHRNLA